MHRDKTMKKIIEDIKSHLPDELNGFSFRKSQEVYIPYLELGIECLIRDVSELNLFFETILKLVDINVRQISDISKILGVSFEVVKETIVDMVEGDYLGVSENTLRITRKGKDALNTKRLIEIKRRFINKIMIDLITGDIYDGNSLKVCKIGKYSICLDKKVTISKEFLDSNYSSINRVFQQQQENDNSFQKSSLTKELYKIVDISYENLVYSKNELLVYENDNTNDIQLQIKNDINNKYLDCLYDQLREGTHPCLETFFEKDFNFLKNYKDDLKLDEKLLNNKIELSLHLRSIEDLDKIKPDLFMQKRYMLSDKEFVSYFTFSNEIDFEELIIITNRVNSILSNEIFNQIKRIVLKKPVIIIYNDKEYNASKTIDYHLAKEKTNRVTVIPDENISETKFYFSPFLEIRIFEKILHAFGKSFCYKSGILNFNIGYENENLKEVISKYKIEKQSNVIKKISN